MSTKLQHINSTIERVSTGLIDHILLHNSESHFGLERYCPSPEQALEIRYMYARKCVDSGNPSP